MHLGANHTLKTECFSTKVGNEDEYEYKKTGKQ